MTVIDKPADLTTHPRIAKRLTQVEHRRRFWQQFRIYSAVAAIAMAILGVGLIYSPVFSVKEIRVVGASLASKEHYITLSQVSDSIPVIKLDHEEIARKIETSPYVQAASSEANWRGEMVITVNEHVAVARFVAYGQSIVTSSNGTVLDVGEDIYPHLPVIQGAMFQAEVGDTVPDETREALALAGALPSDITKLQNRVIMTRESLDLELNGGVTVSFGDTREVANKFDALRSVVSQVETRCVRNINLTAPAAPVIIDRPGC